VGLPGEGVVRLPGGTWADKPGGTWAGERAGAGKRWDKGSVKRGAGQGEKEEIDVMKPSFCAERLSPVALDHGLHRLYGFGHKSI